MKRSVQDPDVQAWRKRIERVFKDCPRGIVMYGIDRQLLIFVAESIGDKTPVDMACVGDDESIQSINNMALIDTGKVYVDSGGW